jgi:iron complex transport system ATP-binding protein
MMDAPPLFHLSGVRFAYEAAPVLDDIGFDIPAGSLFGIIGPNGCGKTTMLKILHGTLTPQAGTVHLHGKSLATQPRMEVARRIGYVPQQEDAVFPFSVLATVLLGRYPHRSGPGFETDEDLHHAEEALRLLELGHLRSRSVTTLSGGERHRVMIARALAQDASVLLLDEPTAHLDLYHQHAVFALLRALCRWKGRTVVCVTHELTLAAEYCDHLLLLGDGRVHAHGAASAVLTAHHLAACYRVHAEVRHSETGTFVRIPPFPDPLA